MKNALLRKTMTKKAYAQKMRKNRALNPFNTGIRTIKSGKDYSRAEGKRICRNN